MRAPAIAAALALAGAAAAQDWTDLTVNLTGKYGGARYAGIATKGGIKDFAAGATFKLQNVTLSYESFRRGVLEGEGLAIGFESRGPNYRAAFSLGSYQNIQGKLPGVGAKLDIDLRF